MYIKVTKKNTHEKRLVVAAFWNPIIKTWGWLNFATPRGSKCASLRHSREEQVAILSRNGDDARGLMGPGGLYVSAGKS
jgi:phage baseplate assembly protein gpV